MASHWSGEEEKFDFFQPRWLWIICGICGLFMFFLPFSDTMDADGTLMQVLYGLLLACFEMLIPTIYGLIRLIVLKKTVSGKTIAIISGCMLVAIGVILLACRVDDFGIIVLFVGFIPFSYLLLNTKEETVKKARNQVEFVSEGRIRVNNCSEINEKVLFMRRHQESMMKFNPATLTYTGVTVGGVTTGGLDYQQEHYSVEGGTVTDRFRLWYKKSDKDSIIVDEVELASSLVSIAKKDPQISKYLKGNTLYLTKETDGTWGKLAADHLKNTGDYMSALNMYAKETTAKLLTKKELAPIYNFICTAQTTSNSQRQTKASAGQTPKKKTNANSPASTTEKQSAQAKPKTKKTKAPPDSKKNVLKEIEGRDRTETLAILSDALSKEIISFEDYKDLISKM